MKQIPELEQFMTDEKLNPAGISFQLTSQCLEVMLDFTKLHVQAALESAVKYAELDLTDDYKGVEISTTSILESYSLENVK